MEDHGLVAELDQGLGEGKGEGSKARAEAADEDQSCATCQSDAGRDLIANGIPFMVDGGVVKAGGAREVVLKEGQGSSRRQSSVLES